MKRLVGGRYDAPSRDALHGLHAESAGWTGEGSMGCASAFLKAITHEIRECSPDPTLMHVVYSCPTSFGDVAVTPGMP